MTDKVNAPQQDFGFQKSVIACSISSCPHVHRDFRVFRCRYHGSKASMNTRHVFIFIFQTAIKLCLVYLWLEAQSVSIVRDRLALCTTVSISILYCNPLLTQDSVSFLVSSKSRGIEFRVDICGIAKLNSKSHSSAHNSQALRPEESRVCHLLLPPTSSTYEDPNVER